MCGLSAAAGEGGQEFGGDVAQVGDVVVGELVEDQAAYFCDVSGGGGLQDGEAGVGELGDLAAFVGGAGVAFDPAAFVRGW